MVVAGAHSIALGSVDRVLDELWNKESSTGAQEEGHPLIRARSLNLVVCSLIEHERETEEIIHEITNTHSARTILISRAARSDSTGLRASVSVPCQPVPVSGAHICGEQIKLSG